MLDISLRREFGDLILRVEAIELPEGIEGDFATFPMIAALDSKGIAVYNHIQMKVLGRDLSRLTERLSDDHARVLMRQLVGLCAGASCQNHVYLWFEGSEVN